MAARPAAALCHKAYAYGVSIAAALRFSDQGCRIEMLMQTRRFV